ncbi:alginate lyase family protein [Bacteroides ovatus]|nr:alginate lyase family protein [Bacteroides ovatus]
MHTDDSHRLLAAGFIGYQFAAPAELMRDYEGWKTEDFEIFKKWIDKTFYPICDDFLDNHFNSSAIAGWMSWDLPAMLTILSIGVLNDDDAKIKQALEFFYHGKGMGCIEWSVRGMHEDPEGKVKGRHLAQSQEMGRDQGHATLNVGLHAYFCRTAYNMGIDLFAYNDNIVLDLCEYTAKYNLTSAEDVEMPFEPYYHPKYGWHEKVSVEAKGRARPGWELLYNHYAKVKGMNAPYSQAFAEKERPEGYGERGTAEAGDLGFGTLLYTEE